MKSAEPFCVFLVLTHSFSSVHLLYVLLLVCHRTTTGEPTNANFKNPTYTNN